jgi:hypothetical protein
MDLSRPPDVHTSGFQIKVDGLGAIAVGGFGNPSPQSNEKAAFRLPISFFLWYSHTTHANFVWHLHRRPHG